MPAGPLNYGGWRKLLSTYPDIEVAEAILGICQYGARIGYEGQRSTTTIYKNLPSALENPVIVTREISNEISKNRLQCYPDAMTLPAHFTASPLGLTDKSDGSKRRIHHLSFPVNDPSSINSGISDEYGAINYSRITEAITAVQRHGRGCLLIKRDFENAFRHIPIAPVDTPLLSFEWRGKYYAERFLPFRLRTAPYLFNLFAETFHWVLQEDLQREHISADIVHYLDDFLAIIPPEESPVLYSRRFAELSDEVGLAIKESKSEQGTTVSFAGVEIDTVQMVIRLPPSKLDKARTIVKAATNQNSLTLLDL